MNPALLDVLSGVGLLVILLLAIEVGFRFGRRAWVKHQAPPSGQIGAVLGAILGLLGLLLGFSFAAAGARFLERQDLIVEEANTIGTAYLRAGLLADPHRAALRDALRQYTDHRVEISKHLRHGFTPDMGARIKLLHEQMWDAALAGVQANPDATLAVLDPVNDVIDIHSTRIAAGRKHLPALVLDLLIASSILAIGTIGYGAGPTGRRSNALVVPLAVLIAMALWITIDLDQPRAGMLRLSDAPLKVLQADIAPR